MSFKLPERVKMFGKRLSGPLKRILLWMFLLYLFVGDFVKAMLWPLVTFYAVVIAVVAFWLITVELYTRYAGSIFSERYVIPVPFANRQATR